jgi:hypothetical protein
MGFWNDITEGAKQKRELQDGGGFETKAAYFGGHPTATDAVIGKLRLDGSQLSFEGRTPGFLFSRTKEASFSIDVESIEEVEQLGQEELKNAPSGYWAPLPIPWLPGYGSKRKHPITGDKLLSLLNVRFRDKHGDLQIVVFGNGGMLPLRDDVGNRIVAARYQAKENADD